MALSGCSGNSQSAPSAAGARLSLRVIPAPTGYSLDSTGGANGQISPALFARFGGTDPSQERSFVAGFKVSYVNSATGEGIAVTVLQFRSPAFADRYLEQTADKTLSFAGAEYKPYGPIPGATEIDATRGYGGNYDHGVVMARRDYYAQVIYATAEPAQTPIEFRQWAQGQYSLLA